MRRISKVIILTIIVILLSSCGNKSYVVFNYNCNGQDYHKCELKNNKLNCSVETPSCGEYKFKGWFRANEYTNQVDLNGTFSKNEIIYARWEKENGVEPTSSQEPTSTIITPGIIDIPSSSKEEPSSSETPSSSQQQPVDPPKPEETYTLSFNLNGGTGGQTSSISGVKYNNDLPKINQTKPTKPGYTFMGWYDKTTGGTQYYNSSNSPVKKYDKKTNTTLYAHWKLNILSIQYNGNGGTWNNPSKGTYGVNSSNTVIIKSTKEVYSQQLNYGAQLDSSGLVDYNGAWFNWKKDGHIVEKGKEYFIQNGSTTTVLDQSKVYKAVELARYSGCDLSKNNCTITVKVNWEKNSYANVNYKNFKLSYYEANTGPITKYASGNVGAYVIWAPDNVNDLNGVSLPVIVWLHGAGELGQSRYILQSGILVVVDNWKKYNLSPVPAIIVAPKSASNYWATNNNYATIKALLAYTDAVYHTDPTKRVLMGHSIGGRGTIKVAYLYQGLNFFAVVPMSGWLLRQDGTSTGYEDNSKVNTESGRKFFSKIKVRGYGEYPQTREFFKWIGKENEYIEYKDYYDPDGGQRYHGKVPERAMTEDLNNDGVSDLMYWLFGDDAKIPKN